jgi:hypothetical protein
VEAEDSTPAEVSVAFGLTEVTSISGYDVRLSVDGEPAVQAFVDGSLGASDLSGVADSLNAGSEFDGLVTFSVENGELVARTDNTGADATLSLVSADLVTNTGVVEGGADPATAQGSDAVVGQEAQLASVALSEFAGLSADDTLKDGDYGFEVSVDGTSYTTIITSPDASSSDAITVSDLPALMAGAENDSFEALGALVDVSFVPGEGVVLAIKPGAGLAPDAEISVPAGSQADGTNIFNFVDAPVAAVADAVGAVDFETSTVLTDEVMVYDLGGEVIEGNAITVNAFFADEFDAESSGNIMGVFGDFTFRDGSQEFGLSISVSSSLGGVYWKNSDGYQDGLYGSAYYAADGASFKEHIQALDDLLSQFEQQIAQKELGSITYDEESQTVMISAAEGTTVAAEHQYTGRSEPAVFGVYGDVVDYSANFDGTEEGQFAATESLDAKILVNGQYESRSITLTAKDGGDDPMNVTGFETDVVSDENSTEQVVSILFFGDSSVDNLTVGSKITVDILGQSLSYTVGDDATGETNATDLSQFYAGKLLEQLEALPEIDAAASSVSLNGDGQTRITLQAATPGQDNLGNVLDSEITVTVERNAGTASDPVLVENSAAAVAEQQAGALVYETSDGGVILNDEDGEGNAVTGRPEETLERSDEGFEGGAPALDTTDVDGQSDDNVDQSVENPSDNAGFYGEAGGTEATQTYTNPDDGFAATEGTPEIGQSAEADDGNAAFAGDPESTGAGNGVTQTHTNPDSGYDAADASPEAGSTNDGDESLSGSEPGQYVEDGLETDYLSGATAAIAGEIEAYDLGGAVTEGNLLTVDAFFADQYVAGVEDRVLTGSLTFGDGSQDFLFGFWLSTSHASVLNDAVGADPQFQSPGSDYYIDVNDSFSDVVGRLDDLLTVYELEIAGRELGTVQYDESSEKIRIEAAEGLTVAPTKSSDSVFYDYFLSARFVDPDKMVEWDVDAAGSVTKLDTPRVETDGNYDYDAQTSETFDDSDSFNAQIGIQQPNLYETRGDGTDLTDRVDALAGEIVAYDLGGAVTEGNAITVDASFAVDHFETEYSPYFGKPLKGSFTFNDGVKDIPFNFTQSSSWASVYAYEGDISFWSGPGSDFYFNEGASFGQAVAAIDDLLTLFEEQGAQQELGTITFDETANVITFAAAEGLTISPNDGFFELSTLQAEGQSAGGDGPVTVLEGDEFVNWEGKSDGTVTKSTYLTYYDETRDTVRVDYTNKVYETVVETVDDADSFDAKILVADNEAGELGGTAGASPTEVTDGDSATDDLSVTEDDAGVPAYSEDASVTEVFSGNAAADVITNFQVAEDVIGIEGDLAQSTVGDAVIADGVQAAEIGGKPFDLSTLGFGLVASADGDIAGADLLDAAEVAAKLAIVFDFSSTTEVNGLNTTIFAITDDDDASQTAIWAHTQSSADDATVDALELNLLGTVETVGDGAGKDEFGIENFAVADGAGGWDILSEPAPV